jgi:hypothetical protein
MEALKVTTAKAANGTYTVTLKSEGMIVERFPTKATTAVGARVQGLRYAARVEAIALPAGRGGYTESRAW